MKDLFEKYYPTKVEPRYDDATFKMPQTIQTSAGELRVEKYNVYKNTNVDGKYDVGAWMIYAQVGDKKMSVPAKPGDLDNYFDHTRSPKEQIIMSFGDRLGLKEHYEQFKLPAGVEISDNQVRLKKDKETNQYQLQCKLGEGNYLNKTLSYYDTSAFFDNKATKQQLVAKHFGDQLAKMDLGLKVETKQEMQKSMGLK